MCCIVSDTRQLGDQSLRDPKISAKFQPQTLLIVHSHTIADSDSAEKSDLILDILIRGLCSSLVELDGRPSRITLTTLYPSLFNHSNSFWRLTSWVCRRQNTWHNWKRQRTRLASMSVAGNRHWILLVLTKKVKLTTEVAYFVTCGIGLNSQGVICREFVTCRLSLRRRIWRLCPGLGMMW